MPKPKKIPAWKLGRVKRADSGGTLWNAINKNGREYYGCPSYDADAMQRRVDFLNDGPVKFYAGHAADPLRVLDAIFSMLDGREWDAATCSDIATLLTNNGYVIREPDEPTGMEEG